MLKMFACEICSKSLSSKGNMQQHVEEVHYRKKRYVNGVIPTPLHQSQQLNEFLNGQFRNKQFENNQFGKQRVVEDVMPSPIHQNKQLNEFENNQFGKGYDMQGGAFDIRLKENFKLFISGPSRCGKAVFVSKLLKNTHTDEFLGFLNIAK